MTLLNSWAQPLLEALLKNPLSKTKEALYEGALLASLKARPLDSQNQLLAVHYKKEEHFCQKGFSLLVLGLVFRNNASPLSYEKEVVIQYRSDDAAVGREATSAWVYPDDPVLPDLSSLSDSADLLKKAVWETPIAQFLPDDEEICAQRLLYNPGRRVTYLLSSSKTNQRYILKMVDQNDFIPFFKKAEAIQQSRLAEQLTLPQLATYSRQAGLFLYHYIPGLQVKKLKGKNISNIKDVLFPEVVRILKTIHKTTIPLPAWDPLEKVERLESNWRALKDHFSLPLQSAADLIRPSLDMFIDKFKRLDASYDHMIHNSFSEKHLLYRADGADTGASVRFGVLDWDSAVLGPKEKDIGQFLAGYAHRPDDCDTFLDLYENETGQTVDRRQVDDFVQYRRLLQLIRKGVKAGKPTEAYLDEVKSFNAESHRRMES